MGSVAGAAQAQSRERLVIHVRFHSQYLKRDRDVRVWLPPGYDDSTRRRYPVLYLHDGQNVFKGGPSFIPGQTWDADTTAAQLIRSREVPPLILVGIDNTGADRIAEYTPSPMGRFAGSGQGASYARMLVEELKPFIDRNYRTLRDAKNTALAGSSLGGLITLSIGLEHPEAFGKLAILSPSAWWDGEWAARRVNGGSVLRAERIWLDVGTREGEDAVLAVRRLRMAMTDRGLRKAADLAYLEAEGAEHNERAWAARFPEVLRFLFSTRQGRPLARVPAVARR